jgi:hypothetical protein
VTGIISETGLEPGADRKEDMDSTMGMKRLEALLGMTACQVTSQCRYDPRNDHVVDNASDRFSDNPDVHVQGNSLSMADDDLRIPVSGLHVNDDGVGMAGNDQYLTDDDLQVVDGVIPVDVQVVSHPLVSRVRSPVDIPDVPGTDRQPESVPDRPVVSPGSPPSPGPSPVWDLLRTAERDVVWSEGMDLSSPVERVHRLSVDKDSSMPVASNSPMSIQMCSEMDSPMLQGIDLIGSTDMVLPVPDDMALTPPPEMGRPMASEMGRPMASEMDRPMVSLTEHPMPSEMDHPMPSEMDHPRPFLVDHPMSSVVDHSMSSEMNLPMPSVGDHPMSSEMNLLRLSVADTVPQTDVAVLHTDVADLQVDVAVLHTDVADLQAEAVAPSMDVAVLQMQAVARQTAVDLSTTHLPPQQIVRPPSTMDLPEGAGAHDNPTTPVYIRGCVGPGQESLPIQEQCEMHVGPLVRHPVVDGRGGSVKRQPLSHRPVRRRSPDTSPAPHWKQSVPRVATNNEVSRTMPKRRMSPTAWTHRKRTRGEHSMKQSDRERHGAHGCRYIVPPPPEAPSATTHPHPAPSPRCLPVTLGGNGDWPVPTVTPRVVVQPPSCTLLSWTARWRDADDDIYCDGDALSAETTTDDVVHPSRQAGRRCFGRDSPGTAWRAVVACTSLAMLPETRLSRVRRRLGTCMWITAVTMVLLQSM